MMFRIFIRDFLEGHYLWKSEEGSRIGQRGEVELCCSFNKGLSVPLTVGSVATMAFQNGSKLGYEGQSFI